MSRRWQVRAVLSARKGKAAIATGLHRDEACSQIGKPNGDSRNRSAYRGYSYCSSPHFATWLACYRMGNRPRTKNGRRNGRQPLNNTRLNLTRACCVGQKKLAVCDWSERMIQAREKTILDPNALVVVVSDSPVMPLAMHENLWKSPQERATSSGMLARIAKVDFQGSLVSLFLSGRIVSVVAPAARVGVLYASTSFVVFSQVPLARLLPPAPPKQHLSGALLRLLV